MQSRLKRLFHVLAASSLVFLFTLLVLLYMNRILVHPKASRSTRTRGQFSLSDARTGSLLGASERSRADAVTFDPREWLLADNETEAVKEDGQEDINDASTLNDHLQQEEKSLDEEPVVESPFVSNISDVQDDDRFQVASKSYLLLYTAYFDDVRKPDRVTIVGIRSTDFTSQSVVCTLSGEEADDEGHVTPFVNSTVGQILDLPESQGKRYRAIYIFCPLPEVTSLPDQVSVIAEKDPVANLLRISYPHQGRFLFKISTCISPVYKGYDIWQQTLESMEMARMLGIDHVNIYVEEAGYNLKRILQYYAEKGFLTVHSWSNVPAPIHDHGQLAIMHDCLLRMRYISKYLIFMDLDEIIVPRVHDTLDQMLDHVLKQTKEEDKVGAILVQNSFFHYNPDSSARYNDTYLRANLSTQIFEKARHFDLKTVLMQFRGNVWKPGKRCKTIGDPLKVDTMAVHHPEKMFKDFKVISVDPEVGMLHHYRRNWEDEKTVRDTTAHKFAPLLVKRLETVAKDLQLEFDDGGNRTEKKGRKKGRKSSH